MPKTLHLPFIFKFDLPGGAQALGKLKRQRPTAVFGAESLQVDEVVGGHDDGRRDPDHLIYLVEQQRRARRNEALHKQAKTKADHEGNLKAFPPAETTCFGAPVARVDGDNYLQQLLSKLATTLKAKADGKQNILG
ncbi:hypothetical protein TYRP_002591 [Tyrophagus putrescentiae]|nr:hypothetical protein TYRP_002591 [Tyrophagus putrescentiae]